MVKDYQQQIERNFTGYPVGEWQNQRVLDIREGCQKLATLVNLACPDGREKAIALTRLEEVMFWASVAITRP